jgi:hypothetical protein
VAQEYQRNHVALYADGNVVPVQGRTPPTLRRVMIEPRAFLAVQKEPHPYQMR